MNSVHEQIIKPMELVREYCSMIHALRRELNIPVIYPLHTVEINAIELNTTLLKDERQLISDEANVDWVEPVWTKEKEPHFVERERQTAHGLLKIRLDTTQDHYLDRRYKERKEHRDLMQARKHGAS